MLLLKIAEQINHIPIGCILLMYIYILPIQFFELHMREFLLLNIRNIRK